MIDPCFNGLLSFKMVFGPLFIQIPARTSSAPPNLDEQKHEQVCF